MKSKKNVRKRRKPGKKISLYPLTYEEAVAGLLATKPPRRK